MARLTSITNPGPRNRRKRLVLKSDIPSPVNPPAGCHFHTRCWLREQLGDQVVDAAVLTTGEHAYRRRDGIAVIPLGLLGP